MKSRWWNRDFGTLYFDNLFSLSVVRKRLFKYKIHQFLLSVLDDEDDNLQNH